MAYNIQTINDRLRFLIRKERGVFITPDEACLQLDQAQLDCFEYWYKSNGETQGIHEALSPFKITFQSFTSNSNGEVVYPNDYLHLLPNVYTVTGSTVNKVRFVNEAEYATALTTQLRPVTLAKPIAMQTASGFVLTPRSVQSGFYSYLRRPAQPVYAYTQVGRTITYNPSGSVQIEFSDIYVNKIMAKVLENYGIFMDEKDIVQFGALKDNQNP